MSLKIRWQEPEASGFTDEIPDSLFASEELRRNASHSLIGPKGKKHLVNCDVKVRGKTVVLDYVPYDKYKNIFEPGTLRLTFKDAKRAGKPIKWEWKDASSQQYEEFEAEVTRVSHEPITEKEVSSASEPFDPANSEDARQKILTSIAARQGQHRFRNALMTAYENACALTGCSVPEVLEAAHIVPYGGKHTNHVQNGLLLRADIHTLFDMDLIGIDPSGIDPSTWKIVLHQKLRNGPYKELHGSTPNFPKKRNQHPNVQALKERLDRLDKSIT